MHLSNMTIKVRLTILCTLAVVGLFAIAGIGWWELKRVDVTLNDIARSRMPSLEAVMNIRISMLEYRLGTYNHALVENPEELKKRDDIQVKRMVTLNEDIEAYRTLISDPGEQKSFDTFLAELKPYTEKLADILVISRDMSRKKEAQVMLREQTRERFDKTMKALMDCYTINHDRGKLSYKDAKEAYDGAVTVLISVAALVATLVGIVGWLVVNGINGGLAELSRTFASLAQLDLRVRGRVKGKDEIGKVLEQFNGTAHELTGVVRSTQDASQTVSAAAHELSAGMESIAATTHQQEAALTSIAASLEQTSVSASEVNSKAQRSGRATEDIVAAITGAVMNVTALANSATAIGTVLEVIKGVSEQINLLSLNAAIEAARAGDAGRGFAVVADEVRKLAGSTSASTDEIARVVTDLQANVAKTKSALDTVGGALDEVRSNSASVVSAVEQQTIAVNTISQSIGEFRAQMASVMHNVQEAQVASTSLSQSAEELNIQTGRFKV